MCLSKINGYYLPLLSVRTKVLEADEVLVLIAVDLAVDVGFVTRRMYCTWNDSSCTKIDSK